MGAEIAGTINRHCRIPAASVPADFGGSTPAQPAWKARGL